MKLFVLAKKNEKIKRLLQHINDDAELLRHKLQNSSIAAYVEIVVKIEGETEKRLLEFYDPQ